ncbi:nucleotide exchange factor GrpE [Nocardia sp. NPDC050710]|uniref:nucleotide exchange factor GrpE n=1 Tax=Nocardia sp. NPDC050710 TaxID=3157220 RepID=UPI0033FC7AFF
MTEPVAPTGAGIDPAAPHFGETRTEPSTQRDGAGTGPNALPSDGSATATAPLGEPAPTLHDVLTQLAQTRAQLMERVEDLSRVIARQAATIERLTDDAKARDRRERQGADLPLVTELFALHGDTTACAATAESDRERSAFEAVATRIERLLVGRGGTLVAPAPDTPFDALTMEAADVAPTDNPDADRTVAALVQPGLGIPGRSVRPARVVVHRFQPTT